MFLDLICQHVWTTESTLRHKYTSYSNFTETIFRTPRTVRTNPSIQKFLKHLTWMHQLNINVVSFQKNKRFFTCKEHQQKCWVFVYKFQNTMIKIFNPINATSNTFFFFNQTWYRLKKFNFTFDPFLIIHPGFKEITFKNVVIDWKLLKNIILQTNSKILPFSVKIYTSYSYSAIQSSKQISDNLIGHYHSDLGHETLFLLLWSSVDAQRFFFRPINIQNLKHHSSFNRKNIYNNTHLYEGINIKIKDPTPPDKTLLNQEYCICQHPETERLHSTHKNTNIKPLSTRAEQKYFLYENLGKFIFYFFYFQIIFNFF